MPLIVAGPTHSTLPLLEKYVREYNIRIAVHNHGPEDKQFPTPQSALAAIEGMDPRVGLCVDVGHTMRAGADPVESLAEAGPRLFDIHMKDLKKSTAGRPVRWARPHARHGHVPAIESDALRGGVMLEYETDEDNPLPGMQKSFAYMRGVLAGLRLVNKACAGRRMARPGEERPPIEPQTPLSLPIRRTGALCITIAR